MNPLNSKWSVKLAEGVQRYRISIILYPNDSKYKSSAIVNQIKIFITLILYLINSNLNLKLI